MSVPVNMFSIVVRRDSIETKVKDGWNGFLKHLNTKSEIISGGCDEHLYKTGETMGGFDWFGPELNKLGLVGLVENEFSYWEDYCEVYGGNPITTGNGSCEWLEINQVNRTVKMAGVSDSDYKYEIRGSAKHFYKHFLNGLSADRFASPAQNSGEVLFFSGNLFFGRDDGKRILKANKAEVVIIDDDGNVKEQRQFSRGQNILVKHGQYISEGQELFEPSYSNQMPILADIEGTVKFQNFIEGKTVCYAEDEATGLPFIEIISFSSPEILEPSISICDDELKPIKLKNGLAANYRLPIGSLLRVEDGSRVRAGDTLALTNVD